MLVEGERAVSACSLKMAFPPRARAMDRDMPAIILDKLLALRASRMSFSSFAVFW